ncbi:hypothetical protein EC973_006163 [Apophysomyces ossiformis]|uniref:Uncharacterized protein n=1 Tax=Apophysomyces ossiformis TaxID=679940 RepID=A0A8H7BGT1_9FUNG|nr:hypothetical protein EC973_006163 [Apophysomyces ossiformis]
MPESRCVRFLADPWSAAKVALPAVAVEAVLHYKVWPKSSLRHLTLYLALINTYWFATTFNFSFLETPFLLEASNLNERQKADCGRHRFNWWNKMEILVGVVSLDLFCEWRKRILDNNGFVDWCLTTAIAAPAVATAAQAAYLLPKLNERAKRAEKTGESYDNVVFPQMHRGYIGFEGLKVAGLAVAGLRFGKMLTV